MVVVVVVVVVVVRRALRGVRVSSRSPRPRGVVGGW